MSDLILQEAKEDYGNAWCEVCGFKYPVTWTEWINTERFRCQKHTLQASN